MSRWDEGLVPKWLSIDRDGFVSIDVKHPDFIRSFKDKFKDFGNVNKKVYTPEQVKKIALSFFDAFPKHDSIHTESCFDAWFEKYGSKL